MAEVLLSPGVSLRENDTSQITSGPITAGLALVGPTVKGRVNIPTLVTTYSDFQSKFGDLSIISESKMSSTCLTCPTLPGISYQLRAN